MCLAGGPLWTNALQFSLRELTLVALLKMRVTLQPWSHFVWSDHASAFSRLILKKNYFFQSEVGVPVLLISSFSVLHLELLLAIILKLMLCITEQSSPKWTICVLPCLRSYLASLGIQELTVFAENLFFSEVYQDCDGLHIIAFLSLQQVSDCFCKIRQNVMQTSSASHVIVEMLASQVRHPFDMQMKSVCIYE